MFVLFHLFCGHLLYNLQFAIIFEYTLNSELGRILTM
jgi:hypothetical protein